MKPTKAVWIVALLLSLAAGLWQSANIKLIWREYSSLYRHVIYGDYTAKIRGPFIPPAVAKQDPEAAAVAEICLGHSDRDWDEETEAVAEKLLLFPNNKFLLIELIRNFCWRYNVTDPQITLKFVDRLIALEPDNADYRYIRCSVLLADRRENNTDAAIEELKYANTCTKYGFLDTTYRQRSVDIANKANVGRFLMAELWSPYYAFNPAVRDIWQKLIAQANTAFTDGDMAKGTHITDTLAQMQNRQLRDGYRDTISLSNMMFFSGPYMSMYGGQPQGVELQRANLTKERAKEDRLQLCALSVASLKRIDEYKDKKEKEEQVARKKRGEIQASLVALPPAVHSGEMFVASLWVCAILLLICMLRGFGEKTKIGLWGILVFIGAYAYYFFIIKGLFWVAMLNLSFDPCCSFSCIDILRPPLSVINFPIDEPVRAALLFAGPIAAALILWGAGFIGPKKGEFWKFWYIRGPAAMGIGFIASFIVRAMADPWEEFWPNYAILGAFAGIPAFVIVTFAWWFFKSRIVRLFLLTTFLGFTTLLAYSYRGYVYYLPMIAFVLTAAIMAVVKPDEGSAFKTVFWLFSSKPDVAAIRNKCLRLIAPFVIISWLLFAALAPRVAKSINLQIGEFKPVERQGIVLPDPNQAYHELMTRFDANSLTKMNVDQLLGLVMPEDLPALLQKLKNKEFDDYGHYKAYLSTQINEQEKARLAKQLEYRIRLNDDDLIYTMRNCGRDAVNIITGFLDDPNATRALVARAKLGDSTAKEKLERLLQIHMQSESNGRKYEPTEPNDPYALRPLQAANIIAALACISEPNEAAERFIDYILNRSVTATIEKDELFYGLSLLPTVQARKAANTYLNKALTWHPSEGSLVRYSYDSLLHVFSYRSILYVDNKIAQDIFKIMLLAVDTGGHFETYDISPYFTIESAPLLKQGLQSKNGDMRAWCVWQLRKIGYKFDNAELENLMHDESWKVRANAAFEGGEVVAPLAAKDKNAFVRLVGSL